MTKEFLNLSVLHLGGLYLRIEATQTPLPGDGWVQQELTGSSLKPST